MVHVFVIRCHGGVEDVVVIVVEVVVVELDVLRAAYFRGQDLFSEVRKSLVIR